MMTDTTKNDAFIGSSLLGSWSGRQVVLSSNNNAVVTTYMMIHFMADPRKGLGCDLTNCREVDNHVCMITPPPTTTVATEAEAEAMDHGNGPLQRSCHDMAQEINVSWSDCKSCVHSSFVFRVYPYVAAVCPWTEPPFWCSLK